MCSWSSFTISWCTLSSPATEGIPLLPVVIPDERKERCNDLSCQIIEGEKFHGKPDDAEVYQKTADGDRSKGSELCDIMPVGIMEREVFIQDIARHDSTAV